MSYELGQDWVTQERILVAADAHARATSQWRRNPEAPIGALPNPMSEALLAAINLHPVIGFDPWVFAPPFITAESGFSEYQVVAKVRSMEELRAAHERVINVFGGVLK